MLCFSTNPMQSILQVRGNTLQQVEKLKYLGLALTSDGRYKVSRLIHGLVKLTQFCVKFIALWSQNGSLQTPQSCQLLNLSLFQSLPMVINQGRIQPVRLGSGRFQ